MRSLPSSLASERRWPAYGSPADARIVSGFDGSAKPCFSRFLSAIQRSSPSANLRYSAFTVSHLSALSANTSLTQASLTMRWPSWRSTLAPEYGLLASPDDLSVS